MDLLPALVRAHLRSTLPGRTRVTNALARRFASLQSVPIEVADRPPVYVDLRDGYAHDLLRDSPLAEGPWEPETQAALARLVRAGDVCWDVGANLGFYVSLLASLTGPRGRVVAMEPNPALLPTLRRTVATIRGATLLAIGLADRDGEATFHIPADHTMGALTPWGAERVGGGSTERTIALRRIDSLVARGDAPPPDVVKMDIEGAEPLAFAGGASVLDREDAPVMLFEANWYASPSYGFDAAEGMRRLLGYARARYLCLAWDGEARAWRPAPLDGSYHGNVLAIPKSRRDRWREAVAD